MFSIQPQFQIGEDFLTVTCSKYTSTFHKERTLDEVIQLILKSSVDNVLFDIREPLSVMTEDDHEICGFLLAERADLFSNCKIAFLKQDREAVLFLSYAYANGFTSFVEVDSSDEASLWFRGEIR